MENYVDKLTLDFTVLGLELDSLPPAQKRELEKSLSSTMRPVRLVVRSDYKFKGPSLNKSQHAARPAATSPLVAQPATPPLTHEEISHRLQKAAADGEIEWSLAGQFHTQPEIALKMVPYDVREAYHIPQTLTDGIQKSNAVEDEGLSRDQIGDRLLRAVNCGAVEPQMLGMFAVYPDRVLQAIPEDVKKSFGLPAALSDTLRKSYAPVRSDSEVYGRLVDAMIARDLSSYFRTRWWREGRAVLRDIPEAVREQYKLPSE